MMKLDEIKTVVDGSSAFICAQCVNVCSFLLRVNIVGKVTNKTLHWHQHRLSSPGSRLWPRRLSLTIHAYADEAGLQWSALCQHAGLWLTSPLIFPPLLWDQGKQCLSRGGGCGYTSSCPMSEQQCRAETMLKCLSIVCRPLLCFWQMKGIPAIKGGTEGGGGRESHNSSRCTKTANICTAASVANK